MIICEHCGKEITEEAKCIKVTGISPLQETTEVSYWCEDCVNEFKAYLEDL
jgi:hypothetical protein